MTDDCIFCRIIRGEAKAEIIYADEIVTAFRDANPTSPVHILIVPNKHYPTLNDVPKGDTLLVHMADTAKEIARTLGVQDSGYRFFINVNKGGGQVVFHLHAHVIGGRDLGTFFIHAAIAFAMLWRKFVSLFKMK